MAAPTTTLNGVDIVMASDGVFVPIGSLAQTIVYNTDGTVNYVQVSYNALTYRQTFAYTAGQLTSISAWVLQ